MEDDKHTSLQAEQRSEGAVVLTAEKKEQTGGWLSGLFELGKIFLITAAIIIPVRYYIAQPFIVRGASMEPTYEDSEYLIVDELSYELRSPRRGEVIIFHYPKDPSQFFIKRIIGLPGETVELSHGRVTILNNEHPDGFMLEEPYLSPPNRPTNPDMKMVIGDNEYAVFGDNRDYSSDSRMWGLLGRKFMVGRALFRAWPPSRINILTGI